MSASPNDGSSSRPPFWTPVTWSSSQIACLAGQIALSPRFSLGSHSRNHLPAWVPRLLGLASLRGAKTQPARSFLHVGLLDGSRMFTSRIRSGQLPVAFLAVMLSLQVQNCRRCWPLWRKHLGAHGTVWGPRWHDLEP